MKLKEGVELNAILDTIRDQEVNIDNIQRKNLLERQDLYNMARDFNIDYVTKRDPNDAVCVHLWVTEVRNHGDDRPVLFYENQGITGPNLKDYDFPLILMTTFQAQQIVKFGSDIICIDGNHGTNSYEIQLYTLMIIDEFGLGYPVGFCQT